MHEGYGPETALVVADVQNDFADPAGSLAVAGAASIFPLLNAEIAAAVAAGSLVAYTQDWHPPVTAHFAKDGGTWPVHCVGGTWGAQLHPGLVAGAGPCVRGCAIAPAANAPAPLLLGLLVAIVTIRRMRSTAR